MKNENFYKGAENEDLLDYVDGKRKEFLEQYLDFSFQEYLEDVYHYSIEADDINRLNNIGADIIYAFNCSLLEDERFLTTKIISHFRESKKKEIFGLSFGGLSCHSSGGKPMTWWYALATHQGHYSNAFDIATHRCKDKYIVSDSEFVGKPLSYLIEHLRKENRI